METKRLFRCGHCGNIICMVHSSGVKVICCGEEMQLMVANTVDASLEKHVPVMEKAGQRIKIKVGEHPHPMTREHYIEWICLVTKKGYQLKYLTPSDEPKIEVMVVDDEPLMVYSYCNIHGLWKAEFKK